MLIERGGGGGEEEEEEEQEQDGEEKRVAHARVCGGSRRVKGTGAFAPMGTADILPEGGGTVIIGLERIALSKNQYVSTSVTLTMYSYVA
jgi:hypothetical protein